MRALELGGARRIFVATVPAYAVEAGPALLSRQSGRRLYAAVADTQTAVRFTGTLDDVAENTRPRAVSRSLASHPPTVGTWHVADRRRTIGAVVLTSTVSLVMVAVTGIALSAGDGTVAGHDPVRVVVVLALPSPLTDGETSLEQAFLRRGSVRKFDPALVTAPPARTAAVGRTGTARTSPSAGGLYLLEVYVAHERGIYHYRFEGHELAVVSNTDIRDDLAAAALDQRALHTAPAVIAIAGVEARSARKYGGRAEQYVHIEVGHAAQNVLLQAAVLGIGAVLIEQHDVRVVLVELSGGASSMMCPPAMRVWLAI